jgi:hypothetical protein
MSICKKCRRPDSATQSNQSGQETIFYRDDHEKIQLGAAAKMRFARQMYSSIREERIADDEVNVKLLKYHMQESVQLYHKIQPQLDLFALR